MAFIRHKQALWDKRHLITVSTHLTTAQYDLLRAACRADATTPYRIVRNFLLNYIEAADERLSRDD